MQASVASDLGAALSLNSRTTAVPACVPKRRVRSIRVPNQASIVSKILVDPTVVVVSLFRESVERVHGVNDRPARILGKGPDQPTGCQRRISLIVAAAAKGD